MLVYRAACSRQTFLAELQQAGSGIGQQSVSRECVEKTEDPWDSFPGATSPCPSDATAELVSSFPQPCLATSPAELDPPAAPWPILGLSLSPSPERCLMPQSWSSHSAPGWGRGWALAARSCPNRSPIASPHCSKATGRPQGPGNCSSTFLEMFRGYLSVLCSFKVNASPRFLWGPSSPSELLQAGGFQHPLLQQSLGENF